MAYRRRNTGGGVPIFKLNTVTKKNTLLLICIWLAVLLVVSLLTPKILYQVMTPHISRYVGSLLNANTIRQSVIWRLNRVAFWGHEDEELKSLLLDYDAADPQGKKVIEASLLEKLPVQYIGLRSYQQRGEGAIAVETYSMLYLEDGRSFYQPQSQEAASIVLSSDWVKTFSRDMSYTYSPVLPNPDGQSSLSAIICFMIPVQMEERNAYVIHIVNFDDIRLQFKELEEIGIHDYMLVQSGRVLYQNLDETRIRLDDYPSYLSEGLQYQTMTLTEPDGMSFMTLCSYQEEDFRVVVYADKASLLAPYQDIILFLHLMLYAVILILLIMVFFTTKGMLRRLIRLSRNMKLVNEGDYTVMVEDQSADEIGALSRTFNKMIRTIRQDIQDRVEREKKEQQMQYSLLVSAIDPHFIYNTLNTITVLARMEQNDKIVQVNNALIGTLKDRLTTKTCKTFDTIQVEKEVLEQYLLIQDCMCHAHLHFTFDMEDSDTQLLIPKNILQPLVENCIKHGLKPHKDPDTKLMQEGFIHITVQKSENRIEITVEDNGVGMSREQIAEFFEKDLQSITENGSEHIGIYNIRMRLSYLFKDNYRMDIRSELGQGTTILLSLPIVEERDTP